MGEELVLSRSGEGFLLRVHAKNAFSGYRLRRARLSLLSTVHHVQYLS